MIGAHDEPSHFRLARDVWPSHYAVRLELDLESWTARGSATVDLRLERACRAITLHAVELDIERAVVASVAARVTYSPEAQTATLDFGRELPAGPHALALVWRGGISERLRGLYRSTRPNERYVATQFEVNDARRAFPCFDEPEYKATWAVELVHPAGLTAVGNGAVVATEPLDGSRVLTRFAVTPKISSYLVAFTVGPYETTPVARTGTGWPVRVVAPPGLAARGLYARDAHVRALQWIEEYTGIPYPYGKVDAIGLPDFEAGAMENPGAITYRTTYIAADPSTATTGALKAVFSVAAHELTHMWWGDLVTMRWWDDLWLNESFASFVGEKCTSALNPEWGYERDFAAQNERAFGLDALVTTHPISVVARSAEEAAERFDAISYTKGQAVLRMLENYVGADAFQRAVRIYLARHREGNATADDFWRAVDEASARDATSIANSWIKEPGFPLVRCAQREDAGALVVTFTQERFYADPDLAPGAQRWTVPLVITVGTAAGTREERVLMDGPSAVVRLAGAQWYFPNRGGAGFYRTLLDDATVLRLAPNIARLSVVERLTLINNQWSLTMARKAGVAAYLRLVAGLRGESDRTVLAAIGGGLGWLAANATTDDTRPRLERLVDGIFRPRLAALGWDVRDGERSDDREERGATLAMMGRVARAADVRAEARRRIDAHLRGDGVLPPDAVAALVPVAAGDGDATLWERFDARRRAMETTDAQDEARFRGGLADFRDPALVRRAAGLIFSAGIRAQDRGLMLSRLFATPEARAIGWDALKRNWDEYVPKMEAGIKQNLMSAISQLLAPDLAADATALLRDKATNDMREMAAQTVERLRITSATAERVRAELGGALDAIGAG